MELIYRYINSYLLNIFSKNYNSSLGRYQINFSEYVKSQYDFSFLVYQFKDRDFKVYLDCYKDLTSQNLDRLDDCIRYFYLDVCNIFINIAKQSNEKEYVCFEDYFNLDLPNVKFIDKSLIVEDFKDILKNGCQSRIDVNISNMKLIIGELDRYEYDCLYNDDKVLGFLAIAAFYFGLSKSKECPRINIKRGE